MAYILLDPGETFEHSHPGGGTSTLIGGEVTLSGWPMTPGASWHAGHDEVEAFTNVGTGVAMLKCCPCHDDCTEHGR